MCHLMGPIPSWLEAEEDMQEVVHGAVPSSTAIFFGSELLSTRVLGPEPFVACGPLEPITLRLRNILREYSEERDLFTEMVQNAEDAGATICRFLLDLRHCRKAITGLLDPGMAACHGPALWAYNNALFTEDDFCNITRVGAATKEHQTGRIGCFGLGFSCVYRITDVPAVLSGTTLLIFDPNGTHLGNHIPRTGSPGIRLDFSTHPRILHAFAEQFRPYQGIFGCHLPEQGAFPGTLFRLPFRTEEEAMTSQICSEAFSSERIQSLGNVFIGSSRLLLLFLKRVKEISLEMLTDIASSPEDVVCLATLQQKKIQDSGAPGDSSSWAAIEQITVHENTSKTTRHYLVLVCQGVGESLELFHQRTKAGLQSMPAVAGVALPLDLTADSKWVPRMGAEEGQVFCHLPLPVASGLPIHVHGAFSILSNRKGLRNTAEHGKWNQALLRDAVPTAWLQALTHLRTLHEAGELKNYEYHIFWPDINTAHYPFTEAVSGFYQAVAARNGWTMPWVKVCRVKSHCCAGGQCCPEGTRTGRMECAAVAGFSLLLYTPRLKSGCIKAMNSGGLSAYGRDGCASRDCNGGVTATAVGLAPPGRKTSVWVVASSEAWPGSQVLVPAGALAGRQVLLHQRASTRLGLGEEGDAAMLRALVIASVGRQGRSGFWDAWVLLWPVGGGEVPHLLEFCLWLPFVGRDSGSWSSEGVLVP
uniref:Sacsin/Nov domain-containing protein n=1 Tax=Nothoprocta perdicaria TaxID=30464 RepID=A0A8C6YS23_NOTPE